MNLLMHYCLLLLLFALLGEVIEIGQAYKVIRPYNYYRRRPWHRPRWHMGQRSPKFYRSKRIPPKGYPYHKPEHYRYRPLNEDYADQLTEDQPYTIVIQLPKRDRKYNRHRYERIYEKERIPLNVRESDFIEDDEDIDSKMFNVDEKKIHIKVTKEESPKLHIKISRADIDKDIEIIDKSNITAMNIPLQPKIYANFTLSMQPSEVDLTRPNARLENVERK